MIVFRIKVVKIENYSKREFIYKNGGTGLIRNLRKLLRKPQPKNNIVQNDKQDSLYDNFDQNVETLRSVYDNCSDVVFRSFLLFGKTRATIIYIEGLSDVEGIDGYVLSPLMGQTSSETQSLNDFIGNKLPVSKVKKVDTFKDCIESISSGNPILLFEGESSGFSLGLAK